MQRLLLTLRYDGSRYHGWQVQKNGVTVQETLQDAVERLTGVRSGIIGCSRTDSGVHANMFCCTFDTDCPLREGRMTKALNAYLPRDSAVYGCREVAADFHPRYAALEEKLLEKINRLGVGPAGIGGCTTALAVNVDYYPTHIAGLPVAVNICCHAARHAHATI